MAKKTDNKTVAKKPRSTKNTTAQVPPVENPEVETPVTTEVNPGTVMNAMTGHMHGKLDSNRRMDMLTNMRVMFHEDPRARQNFGDDIIDTLDDITRAGLICALADEAINGDDTFASVLKASQYPALVIAADKMGIKLPALKALPAGKEEGTVVLDSENIEVSEETADALKEEHKVEEAAEKNEIELDPEKVAKLGEEALISALRYHMISGPKKSSPFTMLTTIVDFMKKYRNTMAESAENTDEAKAEYEKRNMYAWLTDAFSYVTPTVLMAGIGRGMKDMMVAEKSPLSPFIILRNALKNKETGEVEWSDKDIADATRAIIEYIANNEIKADEASILTLDKKDKKYKETVASYQRHIDTNKEVLTNLFNVSFDIVDTLNSPENMTRSTRGRVWRAYFSEYDPAVPYKNMSENLAQRAGIILNLFRAPDNQNLNYSEKNITEIQKYTPDELKEKLKAEKEEATAAKKEESKKD